jgi:small ligand-binding sensory domain FIST
MGRYAAALSQHPVSVEAVGECAGEMLETLDGERPDLVAVFTSPHHLPAFADITGGLRKLLEPDVLIGSSAVAIAGAGREIEDGPAVAVFAANWGGGRVRPVTLDAVPTSDGFRIDGWPDGASPVGTLVLLADPMSFPVTDFLAICNRHTPELRIIGGLASGEARADACRLAADAAVFDRGAVGALLDERVPVRTVVSQGCRPIGQPFTITRAERNLIHELAGVPPLARLRDVVAALDDDDRELIRHGLHVGVVVDEHKVDFARGDFLVRNLLGADEETGAIAVGELVDAGQTVQFHVRDARSADEDLAALLAATPPGTPAGDAALLFTCNGRGRHLFGTPDHDAALVQERLGPLPLAGMFCAGEIGPVGRRAYLHGFTASVAVFS